MEQKEKQDLFGAESTEPLTALNKEGSESARQGARPGLVRRGKLSPGLPKGEEHAQGCFCVREK